MLNSYIKYCALLRIRISAYLQHTHFGLYIHYFRIILLYRKIFLNSVFTVFNIS